MNGNYPSGSQFGAESDIQKYIKDALDSGASREEIEKVLLESGWTKEKINEAFLNLSSEPYQQSQPQQGQPFQQQQPASQAPPYGGYVQQPQFQGYPQQAGMNVYRSYAGFWIRFAAFLLDSLLFFVVGIILSVILTILSAKMEGKLVNVFGNLLTLIIGWLYYALMESSSKQASLGKKVCGLKVTDLNGQRISFARATARHFAKFLSVIFLIGFIMIGFDEKKQGLHDKIAGTLVLQE